MRRSYIRGWRFERWWMCNWLCGRYVTGKCQCLPRKLMVGGERTGGGQGCQWKPCQQRTRNWWFTCIVWRIHNLRYQLSDRNSSFMRRSFSELIWAHDFWSSLYRFTSLAILNWEDSVKSYVLTANFPSERKRGRWPVVLRWNKEAWNRRINERHSKLVREMESILELDLISAFSFIGNVFSKKLAKKLL